MQFVFGAGYFLINFETLSFDGLAQISGTGAVDFRFLSFFRSRAFYFRFLVLVFFIFGSLFFFMYAREEFHKFFTLSQRFLHRFFVARAHVRDYGDCFLKQSRLFSKLPVFIGKFLLSPPHHFFPGFCFTFTRNFSFAVFFEDHASRLRAVLFFLHDEQFLVFVMCWRAAMRRRRRLTFSFFSYRGGFFEMRNMRKRPWFRRYTCVFI